MKNAPNRDTIILWSAVIAGTGLLALLVRHAAIYKFGTDTFTGNVLFIGGKTKRRNCESWKFSGCCCVIVG